MRRFLFRRKLEMQAYLRHPLQLVPKIFFSLVVMTLIVASYNYGHLSQYQNSNSRMHESERLRKDKVLFRVSRDALEARVLVVASTLASPVVKDVLIIFQHMRIKYDIQHPSKKFVLTKRNYRVIIFQNLGHYLSMSSQEKRELDIHCKENKIGIVGFAPPSKTFQERHKLLFTVGTLQKVEQYRAVNKTGILRITRPVESLQGPLPGKDWSCLIPLGSFYAPLAIAKGTSKTNTSHCYMVMADQSQIDGIKRAIFGNGFNVFLEKLLFLDALYFTSHQSLPMPLERYIQIDVDDTLRVPPTSSITAEDITELIGYQKRMQKLVSGFQMNFGVIGAGYESQKKHPRRAEANNLLLENKRLFSWFDHTYHHDNMIEKTAAELATDFSLNRKTLKHMGVETTSYAVAPMHTGVYPAYQPLYTLWPRITNVNVTSTPFYYGYVQHYVTSPPISRGFIYRGIKVLPRKHLEVFTNFCEMTEKDLTELIIEAQNGTTFLGLVFDYVNIYMTHYGNYGCSRPASVVFEALANAITKWTTLRMKTIPVHELAELYFNTFPDEREPLWSNPCQFWKQDPIWRFTSETNDCKWNPFPKILIVGQEDNDYASQYLYEAIDIFRFTNRVSDKTAFFTDNYYRGLDWYYGELPSRTTSEKLRSILIDYDKKAFYHPLAPVRVSTLIPGARVVMVLSPPEARAYTCIARKYSSGHSDMINVTRSLVYGSDTSFKTQRMRFKCLYPGFYAIHLERWLKYFSPRQIMLVDAEELADDLVTVMDDVGAFIGLYPQQHFEKYVRFNSENGSYCSPPSKPDVCLTEKQESPLDVDTDVMAMLKDYFSNVNLEFYDLLRHIGFPIPRWLMRKVVTYVDNDEIMYGMESTL